MKKLTLGLTGRDKVILAVLATVFFLANVGIIRAFYRENTTLQPTTGGEYIEGAVGVLPQEFRVNPLFSENIEADIASLVFAGLMRYDPVSGQIKDHLATHTLSPNKKVYDFTLKDGVKWHDGEPVTAADVMFTYQEVIQNPDFSNVNLKNAFADVLIEQLDEKTVRFTIPETRKTFFTNFTTGLLPKHILTGIPITDLIYDPFNQSPIGCGPYRFEGVFRKTEFTEIRLAAFPEAFGGEAMIHTLGIRLFPNMAQLKANLGNLDGVQPIRSAEAEGLIEERFQKFEMIGPRYLAVFFNLKEGHSTPRLVRQAMRAAIDTDALAAKYQGVRVDTPFVELWPQTDIINISPERAGQLLDRAGYRYPQAKPSPSGQAYPAAPAEPSATSSSTPAPTPNLALTPTKYVYEPTNKKWHATTSNRFYLIGSFAPGTTAVTINGYRLKLFNTASGRFSYLLDTGIGTLRQGGNTYTIRFLNSLGAVIDSEEVKIYYDPDSQRIAAAIAEKMATTTPPPAITPLPTMSPSPSPSASPSPSTTSLESPSPSASPVPSETPVPDQPRYRVNDAGAPLSFTLSYLKNYEYLGELAETLRESWSEIGIEIVLRPLSTDELRDSIRARDYQLILLPQHLGYNLDAYPYFHLSQVGEGGFNLSEWKNLKASVLLEEIRSSHDDAKRMSALNQLRDAFIEDVPAIMLYTPKYTWLVDEEIKKIDIQHMATLPDRFARIQEYYREEGRVLHEGVGYLDFFPWFHKESRAFFSFSQSE